MSELRVINQLDKPSPASAVVVAEPVWTASPAMASASAGAFVDVIPRPSNAELPRATDVSRVPPVRIALPTPVKQLSRQEICPECRQSSG